VSPPPPLALALFANTHCVLLRFPCVRYPQGMAALDLIGPSVASISPSASPLAYRSVSLLVVCAGLATRPGISCALCVPYAPL
jgi:hypothetical protein